MISYAELLQIFWSEHNPCAGSYSTQYASAVYVHDDAQREVAKETKSALPFSKETVLTPILDATRFYLAEDYHQKYYLRRATSIVKEVIAMYPDDDLHGFIDSTAAARLNGYLSGEGSKAQFEEEIGSFGLSEGAVDELRSRVRGNLSRP